METRQQRSPQDRNKKRQENIHTKHRFVFDVAQLCEFLGTMVTFFLKAKQRTVRDITLHRRPVRHRFELPALSFYIFTFK